MAENPRVTIRVYPHVMQALRDEYHATYGADHSEDNFGTWCIAPRVEEVGPRIREILARMEAERTDR